jgi:phage terminase Nu1 subunit (DNA packaging protein)
MLYLITMNKTVTMNVRGIPEGLRRRFRALCVSRGESLKNALIRLMEQELKEADNKEVDRPEPG